MRVAAWGEASYALSACAAAVSGPGGVEGQDAPLVACGPAPCPGLGCFPPRLEGLTSSVLHWNSCKAKANACAGSCLYGVDGASL